MADPAIQRLTELSQSTASAAKRVESAINLTRELLKNGDTEGIKAIIDHVFGPNTAGMLLCRPIVRAVVTETESPSILKEEQLESLWKLLLTHLLKHAGVYEEEETTIRRHLSDLLRTTGRVNEAARCLSEIHWSSQEGSPIKLELLVQSIELFLSAGELKEAETLMPRAVVMASDCEKQSDLLFRVQLLQAAVADMTHQHLEAARRYFELAKARPTEATQYLSSAATCAILSPAGPKRNKILATLIKKGPELREFDILQQILSDRLVRYDDLKKLEETLQPHQRIPDIEGTTLLEKSFRDHNVSASRQIFKTLSFTTLAKLLRTSPDLAERTAAQMIRQGRLPDSVIDADAGYLRFGQKECAALEDANFRLSEIFRRLDSVFEMQTN